MKEMTVKVGDCMPSIPDGWELVLFDRLNDSDKIIRWEDELCAKWIEHNGYAGENFSIFIRKKTDQLLEWANSSPKFAALVELNVGIADPCQNPALGWFVSVGRDSVLDLGVPPDGVKAAKLKYDRALKSWVRA